MLPKYIFNTCLCLYFLSYLLPFADGMMGLYIEFEFWEHAFNNQQLHDNTLSTLWGIRWLMTFMILALWWLKSPEVSRWATHLTNKSILDKALLVFVTFFIFVAFGLEHFEWQFGGIIWAVSALGLAISYQFLDHIPATLDATEIQIERHLVDFDQNELE